MLGIVRRKQHQHAMEIIETEIIIPDDETILDKHTNIVDRQLTVLKARRGDLEADIERLTEELRQTNISIEAFSAAWERLAAGRVSNGPETE